MTPTQAASMTLIFKTLHKTWVNYPLAGIASRGWENGKNVK